MENQYVGDVLVESAGKFLHSQVFNSEEEAMTVRKEGKLIIT